MRNQYVLPALLLNSVLLLGLCATAPASAEPITADHNSVSAFNSIPASYVTDIGSNYNIYYVHTSHGSQIMTGIGMVEAEDSFYDPPYFREVSDDLGHNGDTSWVPATRTYLDSHPECNMAMFSWCGGCSDNTVDGINVYLSKMEQLEAAYSSVTFIYMTGHLDGSGVDGVLYACNNQIRAYCQSHDKILFDFADIESYAPDGTYYPDETDACYWCENWCASHACPTCGSCAHSHCFNCYLKGKAWWWMMARISGWEAGPCCGIYTGGYTGNANCDVEGKRNLADVSRLIDRVYLSHNSLCCEANGNANGDAEAKLNLADISKLIDHVYITRTETAPCQ